jgi:hypothetical protein
VDGYGDGVEICVFVPATAGDVHFCEILISKAFIQEAVNPNVSLVICCYFNYSVPQQFSITHSS